MAALQPEEQTARISEMEEILDRAVSAVRELSDALEAYEALLPGIRRLTDYYESELWRTDFDDDHTGRLPPDLKRGVLSEDGIYDFLTDQAALREKLTAVAEISGTFEQTGPEACSG